MTITNDDLAYIEREAREVLALRGGTSTATARMRAAEVLIVLRRRAGASTRCR